MYRALIVDDEPLMLEGLKIMIDWENHGFLPPVEADSSQKAMEEIRRSCPDLLITDLSMPGIDGVELSQWCREFSPDMLILYFSGHRDFNYAKKGLQVGVIGYLLKPIDPDEVHKVLDMAKSELDLRKKDVSKLSPSSPVRMALDIIDSSFSQDISLGGVAQQLGLSGPYLGQLILSSTGRSFSQLLTEKRMEQGKAYLRQGVAIGEAAEMCGFTDISYFSSQFRKFFGESPSAYRKNLSKGARIK